MEVCPLCNGFEEKEIRCPNCGIMMTDEGKTTDYLDEYSAYMEIDTMKLFDGALQSLEHKQCVHQFHCPGCSHREEAVIE
ncbi:hypothetical protein GKZ89_14560 [Bacillus mangrovi]|uniref:Uncharacterized protein n=1 Tax=Metabacillus mangrovi TaxID=1491830 RepID=A0A7X2S7C7_9BACI|nr:hypothetical protein [Metabacillus mangrovi]MTH54623.1 hypothetical protein [Metabacillus mangrovi]